MTACRCWMCQGPARMKLAAYVVRPPLTIGQQIEQRMFWQRFTTPAQAGTPTHA